MFSKPCLVGIGQRYTLAHLEVKQAIQHRDVKPKTLVDVQQRLLTVKYASKQRKPKTRNNFNLAIVKDILLDNKSLNR